MSAVTWRQLLGDYYKTIKDGYTFGKYALKNTLLENSFETIQFEKLSFGKHIFRNFGFRQQGRRRYTFVRYKHINYPIKKIVRCEKMIAKQMCIIIDSKLSKLEGLGSILQSVQWTHLPFSCQEALSGRKSERASRAEGFLKSGKKHTVRGKSTSGICKKKCSKVDSKMRQ